MFAWARAQLRNYGATQGALLIARVAWSRAKVGLANKFLPATQGCPCCSWTGRRFYDYIEIGYTMPNSACPNCDSHARQRAFYLWLRGCTGLKKEKAWRWCLRPSALLSHCGERQRR